MACLWLHTQIRAQELSDRPGPGEAATSSTALVGVNPTRKTPTSGIPPGEGESLAFVGDDHGTLTDQALRRCDGGGQPDLRGPARCGHRIPGAERVGQVDDDAHDHGPRRSRLGVGPDRRQALSRVGLAPTGGRRPAGRQSVPPGPHRPQPPAVAGPDQRHPAPPGRRGPRPGGADALSPTGGPGSSRSA